MKMHIALYLAQAKSYQRQVPGECAAMAEKVWFRVAGCIRAGALVRYPNSWILYIFLNSKYGHTKTHQYPWIQLNISMVYDEVFPRHLNF